MVIFKSVYVSQGNDAAPLSNCWRTTHDISNDWDSMLQRAIINDGFASVAQPGAFNDPGILTSRYITFFQSNLITMDV